MITFRVTRSAFLFIGMLTLVHLCDSYTLTAHPSVSLLGGISHNSPLFTHRDRRPTTTTTTQSSTLKISRSISLQSSLQEFQSEENESRKNKLLSLTGLRASTKLSIAAMRTTLRGLTGISVTSSMKVVVGLFPTWVSVCSSTWYRVIHFSKSFFFQAIDIFHL